MEQLYPKPRKERKEKTQHRWRVDYDLVYGGDGGGYNSKWKGYYRARWWARVAAWWNVHITSWGGSAILHDQSFKKPPVKKD